MEVKIEMINALRPHYTIAYSLEQLPPWSWHRVIVVLTVTGTTLSNTASAQRCCPAGSSGTPECCMEVCHHCRSRNRPRLCSARPSACNDRSFGLPVYPE